jgi:hypothetical protein
VVAVDIVGGMIAVLIMYRMIHVRVTLNVVPVDVVLWVVEMWVWMAGRTRRNTLWFVGFLDIGQLGFLCSGGNLGSLPRLAVIFCSPVTYQSGEMIWMNLTDILDFDVILGRMMYAVVDPTCNM